jgi:hypothetical protein
VMEITEKVSPHPPASTHPLYLSASSTPFSCSALVDGATVKLIVARLFSNGSTPLQSAPGMKKHGPEESRTRGWRWIWRRKIPRARPNQLVSVRDPSLWSILDEWLYNGAAAYISTSENGTRPSSHEATARPSSGCEEDVFANIPACRRLGNIRCTCPYDFPVPVAYTWA